MPPVKTAATKKSTVISSSTENISVKSINTRSSRILPNSTLKKENAKEIGPFSKRKAASPIKGNTLKRSALGNITNAIETKCIISNGKKTVKKVPSTVSKPTIATAAKSTVPLATASTKPLATNKTSLSSSTQSEKAKSMLPPLPKSRLTIVQKQTTASVLPPKSNTSRASVKSATSTNVPAKPTVTAEKSAAPPKSVTKQSPAACKKPAPAFVPVSKCRVTVKPKFMINSLPNTRRSSGRRSTLESSDNSLYVSALSDVLDDDTAQISSIIVEPEPLPEPEINIDTEYLNDPYQCATYAYEIFEYLKSREEKFKIDDYMGRQTSLSQHVRAVLVDWMVEIQENFEMNHETLYLGVKLVDAYLSKIKVSKQSLQLVGATAMLIAAKYDERIPPAIDDFLYVCDGAYTRRDVTKMEVNILKVIDFELGFPLSYRFLRRYARCAKVQMPLLTLARYVLEYTLMDYSTVSLSDSKLAAAALYLSFKMKNEHKWDNTLIHFSGYRIEDFIDITHILNNSLHQKPRQSLATVKNKYSHKIFYEVAKIPLVSNDDL